jgi:hypothetical protein
VDGAREDIMLWFDGYAAAALKCISKGGGALIQNKRRRPWVTAGDRTSERGATTL